MTWHRTIKSVLDTSSRMKDWSRVGLDRSRPILSRRFAQALHFSPRRVEGLGGMRIPKGPDLAAAWRKTMPVTVAFRRAADARIARSIYACFAAFAILTLFGSQNPACASEIRLLSAASIQEVFKEIIGDFERTSGHKMIIHYSTMGAITDRVRGGEESDLVI
jgi:hypothetical protein